VLLMRTSYAVADELDFVAMDKFQKDFFLFRQAEYLDYLNQLQGSPMAQGKSSYFRFLFIFEFAHCRLFPKLRRAQDVEAHRIVHDFTNSCRDHLKCSALFENELLISFDVHIRRLAGPQVPRLHFFCAARHHQHLHEKRTLRLR